MAKEATANTTAETTTPTKFKKEELIASAHVFGTTPYIMAGALYKGPDELTKDDAKKALAAFLKAPVQKGVK